MDSVVGCGNPAPPKRLGGWRSLMFGVCCVLVASLARSDGALPQGSVHGVSFRVPASLVRVSTPRMSNADQIGGVYRDESSALQLWIVSSPEPGLATPGEAARRAYADGFIEGARSIATGLELSPHPLATHDAELGSYSLQAQATLPSLARSFLREATTSLAWQAVRDAGQDDYLLRCLLDQLLGSAAAVAGERLLERLAPAAISCDTSVERVQRFVAHSGAAGFATRSVALSVLVLPVRSATVAFYALGPSDRSAQVNALIASVRASLEIPESQRLSPLELTAARSFGITLGALLAVLCFGGLGAWLLLR